ncbi:MAG: hypothetical protein V1729_05305 [Candidatus Woesearchaeota archaeon]
MKSIFIAGSRKFYDEIEGLMDSLNAQDIKAQTSGKWSSDQEDTLENQKDALLTAFERIDQSDVTYVFCKDGYVGRTVAMEIAYAHSKGKEVISSNEIEELSAQALVSKVLSPEELEKYCK